MGDLIPFPDRHSEEPEIEWVNEPGWFGIRIRPDTVYLDASPGSHTSSVVSDQERNLNERI